MRIWSQLYYSVLYIDKDMTLQKQLIYTLGGFSRYLGDNTVWIQSNHFIRKPIDNEELLKRINEIILDDNTVCIQSST